MFGYKRTVIAEHERALVIKERSVERVLEPGVYRYIDPMGRTEIRVYDMTNPEFDFARFDVLRERHAALCERYFQVVDLRDNQVALVFHKHVLSDILVPGSRKVYWRGPVDISIEIIDVDKDIALPAEKVSTLSRLRDVALARKLSGLVYVAEVPDRFIGLLIVDGSLVSTLDAGIYMYWTFSRSLKVELVDSRVQSLEVGGQEILSSDKVTLRINLSVAFVVNDAVAARSAFKDWNDYLYRELQFGLRVAVGARSLDNLLSDKDEVNREVLAYVRDKIAGQGIDIRSVGIKDVILPGEMKDIMNRVVEAEKASQTNVVKRREETAATRALLNTARLMDQNPTLLRLKELEVLEKISDKVDRLTVFGGLEGVLKDTVKINV